MARASLSHCEATFFYRALAFSGFLWGEVRVNSNMVEFAKWLLCLQFLISYFHTLNHSSPFSYHDFQKIERLTWRHFCRQCYASGGTFYIWIFTVPYVLQSWYLASCSRATISTACHLLVLDFLIGWNTSLRSNPESWGSNWNISHGNHGKSRICNLMFASFTEFLPLYNQEFPFLSLLISLEILIRH